MADPDTIIISRTWDDQVKISEKHIGGKKMQINVAGKSIGFLNLEFRFLSHL